MNESKIINFAPTGTIRLETKKPTWFEIDMGNVTTHSSCLEYVKYIEKPYTYNDFFILECGI